MGRGVNNVTNVKHYNAERTVYDGGGERELSYATRSSKRDEAYGSRDDTDE